MTNPPRQDEEQVPSSTDDAREVADDEAPRAQEERPVADDHSEREWGGDQDIDTAGQVPDA